MYANYECYLDTSGYGETFTNICNGNEIGTIHADADPNRNNFFTNRFLLAINKKTKNIIFISGNFNLNDPLDYFFKPKESLTVDKLKTFWSYRLFMYRAKNIKYIEQIDKIITFEFY